MIKANEALGCYAAEQLEFCGRGLVYRQRERSGSSGDTRMFIIKRNLKTQNLSIYLSIYVCLLESLSLSLSIYIYIYETGKKSSLL